MFSSKEEPVVTAIANDKSPIGTFLDTGAVFKGELTVEGTLVLIRNLRKIYTAIP